MPRKPFKVQAVATLLGISVDAVRRDSEEAGLQIERQPGDGPKTRLFSIENIYDIAAFRAKKYNLVAKNKRIITVYAPKGGVGKTTQTSNLAAIFALMGLKVLVADLDFQANLTISYGYDPELTREEATENGFPLATCVDFHLGHLLPQWQGNSPTPKLSDVIKKPFGENGPHLIPSEVTLDRLEALFTVDAIMSKKPELAIARFLAEGRSGRNKDVDLSMYDVIMFDAPPAKNQTTRGALLASDFVIAPVSMEKYSTKSVSYLAGVLNEMEVEYGKFPELTILGNFFDMTRVRVAAQVIALTKQYPDAWLDTQISSSEEFKKVLSDDEGMPLALARPSSTAAKELRDVAKSLIKKMEIL
ncbi:chromosome partitioning protein [Janthinobacterium sp. TND4EL3]|uniref:ParA family protein n=1 Tax=Janthinobacterium sp. TND4EL3 TaxID=1907311 RepID=UPI00095512D6|nr:ParA family protein [Janthinobacterium sp. TND4EL3]SIR80265.1 chromosome partitioning protein [Janthinobacterium sp. TND4EL3]